MKGELQGWVAKARERVKHADACRRMDRVFDVAQEWDDVDCDCDRDARLDALLASATQAAVEAAIDTSHYSLTLLIWPDQQKAVLAAFGRVIERGEP